MFDSLLESKAKRTRSVGGTIASVVSHAALVALAVAATANAGIADEDEPMPDRMTFIPNVPPPPPPPTTYAVPTNTVFSHVPKGPPALVPPIEIPDVLPALDLTKAATNLDDWKSTGVRGGRPDGDPALRTAIIEPGSVYTAESVEKAVVLAPGSASPIYPDVLRAAGLDGMVLAQFVVDTLGRADVSTFRVVEASHPLFAEAVRRALPRMRFLPAEAGGHTVRQLVQQPFRFGLDRE